MDRLFSTLTWELAYGVLFVETLVLVWLLTPLAGRIGERFGFVDQPGGRKRHKRPMPRSGGVALFAAFWGVIAFNLAAAIVVLGGPPDQAPIAPIVQNVGHVGRQFAAVFAGAVLIFAVGLRDDYRPMRPATKFLCQIVAVVPLLVAKVQIVSFLPWPWLGSLLTVAWIVLVINSFNFLDNMDGLSAGVGAIVSAVLAWISYRSGEWLMTGLFVALVGTLLGFLRYNFSPARIFMGDSGSMFLGYMIGVLTVLATYYKEGVPTKLPVLTPLIVLGVPLFDTVSVIWIRWRSGRPLTQGDRNHFSHRLVDLGMRESGAVVFIYLTTLCVALGGLLLRTLDLAGALLVALQTVIWFVIIYALERLGKRARQSPGGGP